MITNSILSFLICFVIGFIIGYLDPIVLFRKFNSFCEKYIFPKMIEWRKKWRTSKISFPGDGIIGAVDPPITCACKETSTEIPISEEELEDIHTDKEIKEYH